MSIAKKKDGASSNGHANGAAGAETHGVLSIEIPHGELTNGYRSGHVDTQLSQQQAKGLRQLFDSLDQAGERLENGRRVATAADAIRWMMERIAKKYEASGAGSRV